MIRILRFFVVTVTLLVFSSLSYADLKVVPLHIKCNEESPGMWYAYQGKSKTRYILKTIGMEHSRPRNVLSEDISKWMDRNSSIPDTIIIDDHSRLKAAERIITDWPEYLKERNVKQKKKLKVTALCGTQKSHTKNGDMVNMDDQSKLHKVGVFYCDEDEALSVKFVEPLCPEIGTSDIYYRGDLTILTLEGEEKIDIEKVVREQYVVVSKDPLDYSFGSDFDEEELFFIGANNSASHRSWLCPCCNGRKHKKYRKRRCCCKNCCNIL